MSSDGILKFAHISHVHGTSGAQHRERICGFCEHPISKRQHAVLLKSGDSVHLNCYLKMPKRHGKRGRNSK